MQQENNVNELSLKDIVLSVLFYIKYLKRNFLWLVLGAVIGGVALGIVAYQSEYKYRSDLTFVVNEDDNSSAITLPSFGGAFGMGGKEFKIASLEKILMLSKSENIIYSVLLNKMKNSDSLIVNRVLDIYNVQDEKPNLVKVSDDNFKNLTTDEKRTLRYLKNNIITKNGFLRTSYEDESQIFKIISKTLNEELSYNVAIITYEELIQFYKNQAINKAKKTVTTLENRRDSVRVVLEKGEYTLAKLKDKGSNFVYQSNAISRYRKKREVEINTKLYLEVENLLEVARYKLEGVTPIFTIIDYPYYPLQKIVVDINKNILIGLVLGIVLAALLLVLVRLFRNIMTT